MRLSVITLMSLCFLVTILPACTTQPAKPTPEIQALINVANIGDTDAQIELVRSFDFGHRVSRDGNEALEWCLMAANAGIAEAQNSVGSGYQAVKNYELAYDWYEKAAKQSHALATNNLVYLYDLGLGVTQDRQKGYELYLRSPYLAWSDDGQLGSRCGSSTYGGPAG